MTAITATGHVRGIAVMDAQPHRDPGMRGCPLEDTTQGPGKWVVIGRGMTSLASCVYEEGCEVQGCRQRHANAHGTASRWLACEGVREAV